MLESLFICLYLVGLIVYFKGSIILFFIIIALYYSMKSGSVMPPALFFSLRIDLDIEGFCVSTQSSVLFFSISVKNAIRILMEMALTLRIAFILMTQCSFI